ncbi:DNA polymerase-3 subunit epsilon [Sphingomonas sp. NFR04]|jgi:DNA polymerase-3 subunit epsilon|uniref:3'-5' exonuclease n=1 Tax=Sphingomonas sp. NFR04 TaxID=1566283 RepID=UPI0008E53056|nr:3'-5' exonuclease [Sphingomonas sp. NFR04]SFJ49229.1 DNA polymerase-3 subunit epsilon [Sphingomonas sp. NFR04]
MRRLVNVCDTEGTGLNEPEHRLIEICCRLYDLDTEELVKGFVWRCNPLRKIDASAQKVHGIRLDDLANEPTFDVIAPQVRGVIEHPEVVLVVAHNGDGYDFPFLKRELERVGQRTTWPATYDTMMKGRWATANGKLPRLQELATCCDVPYDRAKAHAAEYDVDVLAQCLFVGRRLNWFNLPTGPQSK